MEVIVFLVPLALLLGVIGLLAFLWSLKSGQFDDLDGAAWRAIAEDAIESPSLQPKVRSTAAGGGELRPI
ncbi:MULTISPECIES: cbb3-type cytochrome oxidase assembly protein CcoS [Bradyrhizobium]|uniref:cbb3-type cytochrome oxidase assembly protein CcoS n=1 Tax=Bradyrhizobium TaxID=374 RepID=UPI000EFE07A4|nr:cbb3-type cytochrome oxidase assembly protein CcoS [Bradyrhizobium vignae]RXH03439.1 cbb3-type cytochrome oxidase assembly protein CcoS [Bradyrhizobium vignae]